ncbi:MAG: hypothetical protein H7A37_07915 [Chlamydiales bacterium]|nr:hypothetical protein [Chlamydiales bacterium]
MGHTTNPTNAKNFFQDFPINDTDFDDAKPMYGTSFDRAVRRIENSLSIAAAVPVLGVIPAIVKFAMGILQATIIAGGELILSPLIGRIADRKTHEVVEHAGSNFKHGLGNIAVSLFEAVPIIGALLLAVRIRRVKGDFRAFYTSDTQEEKFMKYRTLANDSSNQFLKRI